MSARVHGHVEGEANRVILQKLCAVEMWSLIGTWGLLIGYTGWSLSPRDPSPPAHCRNYRGMSHRQLFSLVQSI